MFAKAFLPFIIVIVAVAVTTLMFMNRPEAQREPQVLTPMVVDVIVAQRQPVVFEVASHGEVAPRTETVLMSEVSGAIVDVSDSFVAGGFFNKGEVLLRIDPRNYETALKRARASVAKARTQVSTENALAGYALKDWERLQELRATPKAASELTLRKPQLAEAIAELEFAQAELEKAQGDLSRTIIRAPYDGMVREKNADVGQFVNVGSPLVKTFAVDHAEVRLPLTQTDLQYLDLPKGEPHPAVTLKADIAGSVQTWHGKLVRTEGVYDTTSRVLFAVAQVDDPYGIKNDQNEEATTAEPLRVGTFVTAAIQGKDGGALFKLPRQVIHRNDQVWIVDDEDTLRPREVQVIRMDQTSVYIDGGLESGDRVCLTPLNTPLPGTPVQLQDV